MKSISHQKRGVPFWSCCSATAQRAGHRQGDGQVSSLLIRLHITNSAPSNSCSGDLGGPSWGRSHVTTSRQTAQHVCSTDMKTQGGQEERLGLSFSASEAAATWGTGTCVAIESYRLTRPGEPAPRQDPEEKVPRVPEASPPRSSSHHSLSCLLSQLLLPRCDSAYFWCQIQDVPRQAKKAGPSAISLLALR